MKKGLILCLALVAVFAMVANARVIKSNKPAIPRVNSEETVVKAKILTVPGHSKSVGTADSVANVTSTSGEAFWRSVSNCGGRNIAEDANGNLVVVYARGSGAPAAGEPYLIMEGYSTDGGATWASGDLLPGDSLRRCYSAVTVDAQGWPHFAIQAGERLNASSGTYCGFALYYMRDEAGIGGGLLTVPAMLNDTAMATGTTPYSPDINVRGAAGEYINIVASNSDAVYGILSDGSHLAARSNDGGASWLTTPAYDTLTTWYDESWSAPNGANGPDNATWDVSDDGKYMFDMALGGRVAVAPGDTVEEVPFFSYSNDSGATWTFGGALNAADSTVPRAGLAGVAGGWWNLGSVVFDHNGIVHCLWTSSGSSAAVNGGVDTVEYDPLVHSYNATPGDYTSWTHEIVGNPAAWNTTTNVWTGWHDFTGIAVTNNNDIVFIFTDATDTLGIWGLYAQVKGGVTDSLYPPVLINAMDGRYVGAWPEVTKKVHDDDTVHTFWETQDGAGDDETAWHSKYAIADLGVAGKPAEGVKSYNFSLNQSRPNPSRENANISFMLPKSGDYTLRVYNIAGQLIRTLDGKGVAGKNSVNWNGVDDSGRKVANGVYLYNLKAFGNTATKKLVVVR